MRVNRKLAPTYQRLLLEAENIPIDLRRKLSAPLIVGGSEEFENSKYRLFFIGQETHSWKFEERESSATNAQKRVDLLSAMECVNAVGALFESYQRFDFSECPENRRNRRAPFWRAQRNLLSLLGETSYRSCIWTNLFCCDASRSPSGRASILALSKIEIEHVLKWQNDLLLRKIDAFHPRAIVFASGPNYDFAIKYVLPDAIFTPVTNKFGLSLRGFARVQHDRLPRASFRLYHPAYLTRLGEFDTVLGDLAELIRQDANLT